MSENQEIPAGIYLLGDNNTAITGNVDSQDTSQGKQIQFVHCFFGKIIFFDNSFRN